MILFFLFHCTSANVRENNESKFLPGSTHITIGNGWCHSSVTVTYLFYPSEIKINLSNFCIY